MLIAAELMYATGFDAIELNVSVWIVGRTFPENVTDARLAQYWKLPSPMLVIEEGKIRLANEVQPKKPSRSMVVSELHNDKSKFGKEQLLKLVIPIVTSEFGKDTFDNI